MVELMVIVFYSVFFWVMYLLAWSVIQPEGDPNLMFLGIGFGLYGIGLVMLAAALRGPEDPNNYQHGKKR